MATMTIRYSGDSKIALTFVKVTSDGRSEYRGYIKVGEHTWRFENLATGVGGYSGDEVSKVAQDALSFGSNYTSDNRYYDEGVEAPEWAPSAKVADAISAGLETGEQDNIVTRKPRSWSVWAVKKAA